MRTDADATVAAAFAEAAARWPERPFLNVLPATAAAYGIEPSGITFAEMGSWAQRLQRAYAEAGAGLGTRVLLLLENRPGFVAQFLALNALGAAIVPVNPDLRAGELRHMIALAEPALAVSVPERAAELARAAEEAGVAMRVIGPDDPPPPLAPGRAEPSAPRDREAAMLFTSGTTGAPKGCVLSNLYFLEAGRWYASAGGACALSPEGERMLTPLPVFHMNALAYSLMAMIAVGGCLTVLDRFHPRSWWSDVREARATCLHYLGVMPAMLMKAPESAADRDHSVRFGFGAGCPPELHVAFERRFGFPLVEAWAMTETGAGAVVAANREPRRPGTASLGRPGPELDVRIEREDGTEAEVEEPGELLVRRKGDAPRHGFFTRYHKDAEATEAAWAGGWLHTGDVVKRRAEGDLVFVDRKKNVIRRSGENIAAVEVEAALARCPLVRAAAVAAVPDAVRGDEVFALVVAEGAADAEAARAIVEWSLGELAYYKAPGWIAFADALPLTGTQKIQRAALKARAAELLPQAHDLRALKKRAS